MDIQRLLSKLRKLEDIVARNSDALGDDVDALVRKNAIEPVDKLEAAFNQIENAERLMQVGIVGRVKAGKSSLLNALFFGGQSVLPKAATPMTAALTTLTYGEELAAEVEFYSAADREAIRRRAEEYDERFEEERAKAEKELRKQLRERYQREKNLGDYDVVNPWMDPKKEEQIRAQAERRARRVLRDNEALSAAHDQYKRIQASGVSPHELRVSARRVAADLEALKAELLEFVGSEGRYMPYTKSVHLQLPIEGLRDIRVVDTPGLNDPVPSREERTNELLMHCDVVFIVSPANQFLNAADIQLMGRVADKEGVHEIYLIASQVDNALYGSEIKQPRLEGALAQVSRSLGRHASSTLMRLRKDSPEFGQTFDALIEHPEERILNVSGMCHALRMTFDDQESWGSGERKAWENLRHHYASQFENTELAAENLALLANTERLAEVLESVRQKKDEIIEKRQLALFEAKTRAVESYRTGLTALVTEIRRKLDETDLEALAQQESALLSVKAELTEKLRDAFEGTKLVLFERIITELPEELEKHYQKAERSYEKAGSTEVYDYEVNKDGVGAWVARKLWGGGKEVKAGKRTVVNTAPVKRSITKFVKTVSVDLDHKARSIRNEWRKRLYQDLFREYRAVVGEEKVDDVLARRALNKVAYGVPLQEFVIDVNVPQALSARGRLAGREADDFLEETERFLVQLDQDLTERITAYLSQVKASMPEDIASDFYEAIDKRVKTLRANIENKAETIERLERIARELVGAEAA